MRFLVISTGKNCEDYAQRCIRSVIAQNVDLFHVVVSDGSTDKTVDVIKQFNSSDIQTASSEISMTNVFWYEMTINTIGESFDVVVWLDLDDYLLPNALEKVAKVYEENPDVWMTYGNYITDNGEQPFNETNLEIPDKIHQANAYRKHPFMFMHLRTFRPQLFSHLTDSDIFTGDTIYPDANMLYCLMEMSGKEHMKAITEPLYVYNKSNPINVERVYSQSQRHKELQTICNRKPKQRLSTLS